jgi:hypothetical protein
MARLPYAERTLFEELIRQTGFPENTPPTNAFRMLAHAPSVAATLTAPDLAPGCGSW